MLKNRSLLCIPMLAVLLACNNSSPKPAISKSTQWRFESYTCAFGCDPMLDQVLKSRIGEVLNFQAPARGFDLFSECGGTLSLIESKMSREELLHQLNQTVSPDRQFTAKNTNLDQQTITTAQAICHEKEKTWSTFWVVSMKETTMKVYFEGASFLNFEAIQVN